MMVIPHHKTTEAPRAAERLQGLPGVVHSGARIHRPGGRGGGRALADPLSLLIYQKRILLINRFENTLFREHILPHSI